MNWRSYITVLLFIVLAFSPARLLASHSTNGLGGLDKLVHFIAWAAATLILLNLLLVLGNLQWHKTGINVFNALMLFPQALIVIFCIQFGMLWLVSGILLFIIEVTLIIKAAKWSGR